MNIKRWISKSKVIVPLIVMAIILLMAGTDAEAETTTIKENGVDVLFATYADGPKTGQYMTWEEAQAGGYDFEKYTVNDVDYARTYSEEVRNGIYGSVMYISLPAPPEANTISISATVEWVNKNNSNPPSNVQVQLFKNGREYGDSVTFDSSNNWTHIWIELEEFVVWTVDELNLPNGYTKTVSGNINDGFVIINTYEESSKELPEETQSGAETPESAPKTGDSSDLWSCTVIAITCFLMIYSTLFCKK